MRTKVEIRRATPLITNRFHEQHTMQRMPSGSASGRFPANRAGVVITICEGTADGARITCAYKSMEGSTGWSVAQSINTDLEAISHE